jgi:hypothetical protein
MGVGVGVVVLLLVVLFRKRSSSAVKVLATLGIVALLLFLLVVGLLIVYWNVRRDTATEAATIECQVARSEMEQLNRQEADRTNQTAQPIGPQASIPSHIEFKVIRVENPPGTRDIM